MDIIKVFGSNVKKYRISAELSQEAFAEKCGLHRTLFMEQDCAYWNYSGRKMFFDALSERGLI